MTEESMSEQMKQKVDPTPWDEHLRLGMQGLREEVKDSFQSRANIGNARKHGRAAMKEMLLAWRSLLDGAIERIDEVEKSSDAKRVTKIKIE